MTDNDDPFGFKDGDTGGRTVVKPMPGGMPGQFQKPLAGNAPGKSSSDSSRSMFDANTAWPLDTEGGLNPIERSASSLLVLQSKLANSSDHPDPDRLRERVKQEIQRFENNARKAGVNPEDLFVARYVLCTAIDEAVLNTPWGARSNWDMQSLLVTFHKEAQGGVRFFQLLKQLSQDPQRNRDLLELMYICLALGFKGKYRHEQNGPAELERIREQLYRDIRQQRQEFEHALSPHWEGVGQTERPLANYIPWWVVAAGLAVVLLAVYALLSFRLSDQSAPAFEAVAAIDAAKLPQRVVRLQPPKPLPVVQPPAPEVDLSELLRDEIAADRVVVEEDQLGAKIVIRGDGLFRSGSAQVQKNYVDLLRRIAIALDEVPGRILVVGHTDDIPIKTLRFPSNWHLSRARADAVLKIMAQEASDGSRFESEGRGDKEPLVANDSKANRARNRRVEVLVLRHAATPRADS